MKRKGKNLSKRLRRERGITLVALVITIVILIILATVTINVAFGEGGLIQRTQQAKNLTEQATRNEQEALNSLMDEYANIMAGENGGGIEEPNVNEVNPGPEPEPEAPSTVDEAKESGETFGDTTEIKDDLENIVTIPGGFHIAEDSGTKVEEGIVIEDSNGNQFVWIPVGEYNVSTTINASGKLTNNLSRRKFTVSGATEVNGDDVIDESFYGEGDSRSVAYNQINAFKTSATSNSGFYIGRYEQGEGNVCKARVNPYINITRDQAKTQAEVMYSGNSYVTSELISSYAWDTALNFICQTNTAGYRLTTASSSSYGNIGTKSISQTGEYSLDKYSNVYDLLGNCREWTTEYSSGNPGTCRGGNFEGTFFYAAYRYYNYASTAGNSGSFRLQLYLK